MRFKISQLPIPWAWAAFVWLLCVMVLWPARAADGGAAYTLDLGFGDQGGALPSWLTSRPVELPAEHAVIGFAITPPADNTDLAVTFYFTETPGGFLRVYWKGAKDSEMLAENLYEGIGMANQRTLLIKRSTLSSPGTLYVQSSESTLNVSRVHWEWVTPSPVSLADSAKQTVLVSGVKGLYAQEEVDGSPAKSKVDEVGQSVVTAALTDKPERIEGGVEFTAALQAVPQFARVEVKLAGVAPGKAVGLWVNGTLAGGVTLEVPDLNDPGYSTVSDGATQAYTGWRKGSIYIPASLLASGDNRFQFAVQDATASMPIAIKDFLLQLKYPSAGAAPAPAATPAPSSTTGTADAGAVIPYRYDINAMIR